MKIISILGSTGSIGTQTLDVIRNHKDKFDVFGLSANSSVDILINQILEFNPKIVCIYDEAKYSDLKSKVDKLDLDYNIELCYGLDGLIKIADAKQNDILLTSVVGMIGLIPTLTAIKRGTTIALANKETLVTAGKLVMDEAKKHNVAIIPVDSEHSAIFQCLVGENTSNINKIILTASGGPFRGLDKEAIAQMTKSNALKHPNWSMGQKITIDSATLMNKGLEVIEAKWLFDLDIKKIDVLVHPQSIIHSMVEFKDKSIKAQLGTPNMKGPIQYALGYPQRLESQEDGLDFIKYNNLTFEKPDYECFPCLKLAFDALEKEGTYLSVLNAANEEVVYAFLNDKIKFYDISNIISEALSSHDSINNPDLNQILEADKWARRYVNNKISKLI
ncbi:MAG: 1-deoxy-D-xylulose-5-phosphate reductoisomerase [Acetoanaerobium sp.]|nr:1-deoxy-D-xylulose-5-phosphate reductoisomerase [Acetoanaerobium sp.]